MTFSLRNIFLFTTLSLTSLQVYAADDSMHLARPPYHINPTSNFYTPSGLTPAQIRQAYGFASFPLQGAGQIIGIIDAFDHPNIEQDLAVFNDMFGLTACTSANGCFQKIYARGTQPPVDPNWALEIALDVEWAHAIAPQAKILLVEAANNSLDELAQAVRVAVKNGANVISMSWGTPEFKTEAQYDRTFNVRHITFTAASGDSGAGTNYPAASPYVLSVGGTSLSIDSSGTYFREKAWSGSGGGLSLYEKQLDNQRKFPIPNNMTDTRGIPDVAYHADPNNGYSVYSTVAPNNQNGWFIIGGTSAGTPQWAALIAIANTVVGEGLNINTVLYRIGKAASYPVNYHDITKGGNGNCGYFCETHPGYDYVTGLGTPIMPTLVKTIYEYYLTT